MPERAVERGTAQNDGHGQLTGADGQDILVNSCWHLLVNRHWLKRRDFLLLSTGAAIVSKPVLAAAVSRASAL